MAQQTINVATNVQPSEVSAASDFGTGESLHTLTVKCAANFADLLARVASVELAAGLVSSTVQPSVGALVSTGKAVTLS